MIQSCPDCQAELRARKRDFYVHVILSDDRHQIISARHDPELADDGWQVVCENGHDLGVVAPSVR